MERRISGPDQELPGVDETAKWLNVPLTTLKGWIRDGRVPAPLGPNKSVQYYPWEMVYSMRVMLGCGFLPLPERAVAEE